MARRFSFRKPNTAADLGSSAKYRSTAQPLDDVGRVLWGHADKAIVTHTHFRLAVAQECLANVSNSICTFAYCAVVGWVSDSTGAVSDSVELNESQSQFITNNEFAIYFFGSQKPHSKMTAGTTAWKRFVAPYYALNLLALLVYPPIRVFFHSPALDKRDGFLGIPRVTQPLARQHSNNKQ